MCTLVALALCAACADKSPSSPSGHAVQLQLQLGDVLASQVGSSTFSVDLRAGYDRTSGARVELSRQKIDVTNGTQSIELTLDLAPCLADQQRSGALEVCRVILNVALRDGNATLLDSVQAGPFAIGNFRLSDPVTVTLSEVASIALTPSTLTLAVGDTMTVVPVLKDANGAALQRLVTWKSAYEVNATVSSTGQVTAQLPGSSTITATSGRKSATLSVGTAFAWKALSMSPGGNAPFHTCGILADNYPPGLPAFATFYANRGHCWGPNSLGQLGTGTASAPVLSPTFTAGAQPLQQISAGGFFGWSCAITAAGATICWGTNSAGDFGNGTTNPSFTPTAGASGLTLRQVIAGHGSTCGITVNDAGFCWGNGGGGVGDGQPFVQRNSPVAVAGGIAWNDLRPGFNNTCGLSTVGQAFCWGAGTLGANGDGTTNSPAAPVPVAGGLRFIALRTGANFACGISTAGAAFCWGDNESGQLGVPTSTTATSLVPIAVSGGKTFKDIALGTSHACALTANGEAWCWGNGLQGQLGNNASSNSPTPVLVSGGFVFARIYAGGPGTCALTAKGIAYCWGDNFDGQLGDGTTTRRLVPTRVKNPQDFTS